MFEVKVLINFSNSTLANCGPLSEMTSSHIPYLAKCGFICLIIIEALTLVSFDTSKNFE